MRSSKSNFDSRYFIRLLHVVAGSAIPLKLVKISLKTAINQFLKEVAT